MNWRSVTRNFSFANSQLAGMRYNQCQGTRLRKEVAVATSIALFLNFSFVCYTGYDFS